MPQVFAILAQQIVEIWKRFGINQKVSIILALLAALTAISALIYWSTRPDFRLVYAGLPLKEAAAIREKIEEAKIPLELRESGSAIYVPAGDVARVRLMLAAEGLPKTAQGLTAPSFGFELFEKQPFGQTDFVQQINYQRALQGELERTLRTMNGVEDARVLLVMPKKELFATEQEKKASASVMLKLNGGVPGGTQIRSVTHLLASAVPGLDASAISVVDQDGRLLSTASTPDQDNMLQAGDQLTIQKALETQLAQNVQSMLDKILGGGKQSVVKVSTDLDFSRVERQMRNIDKEGKVVKVEKILSENSTRPGTAGGASGLTPNSPNYSASTADPTAKVVDNLSKTKKENIQTEYGYPEGVESILETGARIRRLSVSVCVAKGSAPRTEQQMQALDGLVKAAVGYVNDPVKGRIDTVEVKELEFQAPESAPPPAWWTKLPIGVESLARGILLTVLLFVVFLAGRRIMASARVQSADIGMPVHAMEGGHRADSLPEKKEVVDVDLFETLQAVKEDPKKAVAWIRRTIEGG